MSLTKSEGLGCDMILRNLDSLLKKSLGDQTIVLKEKSHNLLPKGENYGSTILKVSATVRRTKNSPEEDLELIAKMIPATEFQRTIMNHTVTFKKEIFIFDQLIPTYVDIQREAGLEDSELLDILPKNYGCRLSLNPESEEADEDVVMLMENLQTRGYKTMNRKTGLDIAHAKLAAKNLAIYHALGIVCSNRKPVFFKNARTTTDATIINTTKMEDLETANDKIREILCSDPRVAVYEDRIKKMFTVTWEEILKPAVDNEWSTITHGDFWVNNMLFHHDERGNPDNIKFIDFQLAQYNTCLRDLPYLMFASCNIDVLTNHFEEFLSAYHTSFVQTLQKLKFDASLYNRKNFDDRLKQEASNSLVHITMALKFFTMEVDQDVDLNDMMKLGFSTEVSDTFRERIFVAIKTLVAKNWI